MTSADPDKIVWRLQIASEIMLNLHSFWNKIDKSFLLQSTNTNDSQTLQQWRFHDKVNIRQYSIQKAFDAAGNRMLDHQWRKLHGELSDVQVRFVDQLRNFIGHRFHHINRDVTANQIKRSRNDRTYKTRNRCCVPGKSNQ